MLKNVIRKVRSGVSDLALRLHSKSELKCVKCRGANNVVFGNINIINPRNVQIGGACSFNHNCYINAFNPIEFGDDVTVSAGAAIVSTGIDYQAWADGQKGHIRHEGIKIGDHVWIGARASIVGNVKITGKYVVIAAGAVVVSDIEDDYCIVGGVPARIIKHFGNEIVKI